MEWPRSAAPPAPAHAALCDRRGQKNGDRYKPANRRPSGEWFVGEIYDSVRARFDIPSPITGR